MVFSLIGTFGIFLLSYKLSEIFLPYAEQITGGPIKEFVEKILDASIGGTFSNLTEIETVLGSSWIVKVFEKLNLFENITFEGELTAGQIFAPSISMWATKILVFVVIYLCISLLFRLLRLFFNKLSRCGGLNLTNRLLGAILGLLKALLISAMIYFLLIFLSSIILNKEFSIFVENAKVSKFLFSWIVDIVFK